MADRKEKVMKAEVLAPQDAEKVLKPYQEDMSKVMRRAVALQVTSKETELEADAFITNGKRGIAAVEEERVFRVKPLNDHVKWLNGMFNSVIKSFEEAIGMVEGKRATFRAREAERIAEANRVREKREAEERERIEAEKQKEREKAEKEFQAEQARRKKLLEEAEEKERKAKEEARKASQKKDADEAEIRKKKKALQELEEKNKRLEKEQEQARKDHQKELEQIEKDKKEALKKNETKNAQVEQATTRGNTSFTKRWDAAVDEISEYLRYLAKNPELITDALELKLAPLRKIAVETEGKAKIPGVRFFQKEVPQTKTNDFFGGSDA